jgi:hypothetical protein
LNKGRKQRARRTRDAICGCRHTNVLTKCHGRRSRRHCC